MTPLPRFYFSFRVPRNAAGNFRMKKPCRSDKWIRINPFIYQEKTAEKTGNMPEIPERTATVPQACHVRHPSHNQIGPAV
jgi:hypothetical protein